MVVTSSTTTKRQSTEIVSDRSLAAVCRAICRLPRRHSAGRAPRLLRSGAYSADFVRSDARGSPPG